MNGLEEQYRCRKCGKVYLYSLSQRSCGGVCDKIENASSGVSSPDEQLETFLSSYPEYEPEKHLICHIADMLNKTQSRKTSIGFVLAWLLGAKGIIAAIASLLTILSISTLIDPPEGGLDTMRYIVLLCLFLLGLAGIYVAYLGFRMLRMLKYGYFTLGLRVKSGVFVYKDESGVARQWTSTWFTRLLQQQCPDCNSYILNLIAVDRANPDRILIVDFSDFRETNSEMFFYIPEWFTILWLPVTYDLSRQIFSTTYNYFWKWLAIIAGFMVFFSILDYFNL